MVTNLKGRDYIETQDFSLVEIETFLEASKYLKLRVALGEPHRLLKDKTIFLIFYDKSTRTRNAFEAGATQLGAHAHFLLPSSMQIAHGESPRDTGIILSRMGHGIAIRHDLIPDVGNAFIREVAKHADCPIINMQCDVDHPTQALADIMTIRERFGQNLRGLKIAMSWAYSPSYAKPLSVAQGVITLMTRFGMNVTLAHPKGYDLMPRSVKAARENARVSGGNFEIVHSMEEAFKDADIVYPKSWGTYPGMIRKKEAGSEKEIQEIEKACLAENLKHKSWICDSKMLGMAKKNAIYMHPLPADRGDEVTNEVIDGPQSVVFDQAENRLHTAKAIMALSMGGRT